MDVWRCSLSSKDKEMARRSSENGCASLEVGTKMDDIFTFLESWLVRQRLVSEPRPPILPLAATLMCPWPCAARPYLASLVFLNSWVSKRGMTSGAQTFGR